MTASGHAGRLRASPGVLAREVHGESVLLHLDSGEYFGLDEVATRTWQLIGEYGDLARVEAALIEEYAAPPEQIARDLHTLVTELVGKRLLEVDPGELR